MAPKILSFCIEYTLNKYPGYFFKIDAEGLAKEIERCFASALASVLNKKEEEHVIPGFSKGFIMGYLSSSLSVYWYGNQIYPMTEAYKDLMLLKSILSYLKFDHGVTDKIGKIYQHLIECNSGLDKSVSDDNIVFFENIKNKNIGGNSTEFANLLFRYLESILLEKHNIAFDALYTHDVFLDAEDFFGYDDIRDLISQASIGSY